MRHLISILGLLLTTSVCTACEAQLECNEQSYDLLLSAAADAAADFASCDVDDDCETLSTDALCNSENVRIGGCDLAVASTSRDEARTAVDDAVAPICARFGSCSIAPTCDDNVPRCVDGACAMRAR